MTIIKKIADMIEDELEGAEHYAKCAVKWKDEHPTLAKTFYDISTDEVRHVGLLHAEVVNIIENHRKTHGEPPANMLAIWEYVHEKHIEKMNEVKMLQNQYRGA